MLGKTAARDLTFDTRDGGCRGEAFGRPDWVHSSQTRLQRIKPLRLLRHCFGQNACVKHAFKHMIIFLKGYPDGALHQG